MHQRIVFSLLIALSGAGLSASETTDHAAIYDRAIKPLLATYCVSCHDTKSHKGEVDFSEIRDGRQALSKLSLWRSVGAQLAAKDMPPPEEKQPSADEVRVITGWIRSLKSLQPRDPGIAAIRRLSRVEYSNTMRDLFGTPIDAGADLPPDNPGAGFDNSLSPLLAEKYLLSADAILDRFIVPEQLKLTWPAAQLAAVISGKPDPAKSDGNERTFTTPGEIQTAVNIPVEGPYTFKIRAGAEAAGAEPVRVALRIDGKVVQEFRITAKPGTLAAYTCTTRLAPGRIALSLLYANPLAQVIETPAPAKPDDKTAKPDPPTKPEAPKKPAKKEADLKPRSLTIESIELVGPSGKPPTEIQRRLFSPMPGKDLAPRDAAEKILTTFATRAYRRPLREQELGVLLAVYDLGVDQDLVFSEAMKLAFKAVLVSPQFLYRTPEDDVAPSHAGIVEIGDFELASRLSYVLWATMPDEELMTLARERKLRQPEVLAAQVKRLIADPRARALAETFAAPWLGLDKLDDLVIDPKRFPMVTPELRQAMYEEGMAYFLGLLQGGGSLLEGLDSDYAYMNAQTAKILYGLSTSEAKTAKMQKVKLSDANRGGMLTMPGVLAVTSMPARTSPVKRGKWILEQLLDAAPPPPPANVPDLSKQDTADNSLLTLRQRTEKHRTDPACAACHRVMDPLGFGLENFDAIGRWRERDDYGAPVDAIGELPGKVRFRSPAELRKILLARKDEFVRGFTGKLLSFALGRRLAGYDEVVADDLAEAALAKGARLDDLVLAIVTSYPFLNRHALRSTN